MLTAPSGAAGLIARHHTAVLSAAAALSGIATAVAAVLAGFQSIVWIDVAALALGAGLAGTVAFWQTRHLVLAAVLALTPLPGLIWAAPLSGGARFSLVPALAYGFGYVLASLYAQHVLGGLLECVRGERPWRAAGAVLALAGILTGVWFALSLQGDAAIQMTGDLAGVSASVLALLPLSMSLLHFDEAFVATANRARERRGHLFERLSGAVEPRWGLSFTGIALIFSALGWFDAAAMLAEGWWRYSLTSAVVVGGLGWIAGGWREGLSLGLVLAVVCLTGLWWMSYGAQAPFASVDVFGITMIAGLLAVRSARQILIRRRHGEASPTVLRRALEEASPAVLTVLGAAAAILPWLVYTGAGAIMLTLVSGGLAGALLFPIALTAIEVLIPRRRSVDEVFGKPQA